MTERKTMNVSMSPHHQAFVKAQVATGHFRNDSEVVRAALRLLEEQTRKQQLEELLLEGLKSGNSTNLDNQFWADLRKRVTDQTTPNQRESA